MPRQAVYVLASRTGNLDKKQEIVENYRGETKAEMRIDSPSFSIRSK